MTAPVWTTCNEAFLDGTGFTERRCSLKRDGIRTEIRRISRTNGRPRYQVVSDIFQAGDETFDFLASGFDADQLVAWLEKMAGAPPTIGDG